MHVYTHIHIPLTGKNILICQPKKKGTFKICFLQIGRVTKREKYGLGALNLLSITCQQCDLQLVNLTIPIFSSNNCNNILYSYC